MDVVATTVARYTTWKSDTSVIALSRQGSGVDINIIATVTGLVGSATCFFTYNSAAMTVAQTPNFPVSGGNIMTIDGVNFGVANLTPSTALAPTPCELAERT